MKSRVDGDDVGCESRIYRNGRDRRRGESGSLATRSRRVPRGALIAVTLVYSGDGFGLVRAEELKHGARSAVARGGTAARDIRFDKSIRDMSGGAS